jgi:LPS-assembly protein
LTPAETPSAAAKQDDSYPLFIIADQIEGLADDSAQRGQCRTAQGRSLIYADRLTYHPLEDEVEATGNVRLLQDGAEITGPHLKMRMAEQIGSAEEVTTISCATCRAAFMPRSRR